MSKIHLKLDSMIDGAELRRELSALTEKAGGDGSGHEIRSQVLQVLKDELKRGRTIAEKMLMEDKSGTACAVRLSHHMDELIRALYDFSVTHVYRSTNPSSAERMAVIAVGGYGRGTLAPGSDIDLLFLLPYKQTPWGEQIVEYMLYMLWDHAAEGRPRNAQHRRVRAAVVYRYHHTDRGARSTLCLGVEGTL